MAVRCYELCPFRTAMSEDGMITGHCMNDKCVFWSAEHEWCALMTAALAIINSRRKKP
jgi:hypothetical protein